MTFISTTALSCDFPIKGAKTGFWDVTVTNPGLGDETGTLAGGFRIDGPPPLTIDSISPVNGTNMETIQATIIGTNFTKIAAVYLVNESLSIPGTIQFQRSTSVVCSFKLVGAPTKVFSLILTKTDGSSGSLDNCFTITSAPPSITTITPSSGYNFSSVQTVVTGTNFRSNISVNLTNGSTVIGGLVGDRNLTGISCSFPLNGYPAGIYNLNVMKIDGTSATKPNAITVREALAPTITDFSPSVGINNTKISYCINGTNLEKGAKAWITNGSRNFSLPATKVTPNQIKGNYGLTVVPFGVYNLTVQNPYGTAFTVQNAITIKTPTPRFGPTPISPKVVYNTSSYTTAIKANPLHSGVEISLVNGSTTIPLIITSRTNSHAIGTLDATDKPAGIYNLTVVNPGGPNATKLNAFTVLKANTDPTITSFAPLSGPNTSIVPFTVNGTNFKTGAKVTITNGTTTKTVTGTLKGQTVSCSLPLTGMPLGLYTVTVANTDGSENSSTELFAVTNPTPTITTVAPTSAFNTSPVEIAITWTNFVSGLEVSLINGSITIVGSVSALTKTKFTGTFPLPGNPVGIYNLKVINPGGPNATKVNLIP